MGKSTAIVAWGRFQPPTKGHDVIANQLVDVGESYAKSSDVSQVSLFLFPSQSNDSNKNPLTYFDKVDILEKLYGSQIHVAPESKDMKNLLDISGYLQTQGYDNLVVIVGSDRVMAFRELLNKYNGNPTKGGDILYEFDSIEVLQAGATRSDEGMKGMVDPDESASSDISASAARQAVKSLDLSSFTAIFAKGFLSDFEQKKLAKEVYTKLLDVFGLESEEDSLSEERALAQEAITESIHTMEHTLYENEIKYSGITSNEDEDGFTFFKESYIVGNDNLVLFNVVETIDEVLITDAYTPSYDYEELLESFVDNLLDIVEDKEVVTLAESFATALAIVSSKANKNGKRLSFDVDPRKRDKASLFNNTDMSFDFRSNIVAEGFLRTPPLLSSQVYFA